MPYPRPILKHFGGSSDDSDSPNSREGGLSRYHAGANKVHFPNHPDALTRTHVAHSPEDYDRSPIRIKPNICALPERGCPGRTYSDDGMQIKMDIDGDSDRTAQRFSGLRRGDHRHPCARVVGFLVHEDSRESSSSPPLLQDSSDSSEGSNSVLSPFLKDPYDSSASSDRQSSPPTSSSASATYLPYPSPRLSPKADPAQLAFLPYPHSVPTSSGSGSSSPFYSPEAHTRDSRSVRRSPSSPTRQRRRSRSRVRESPVRERYGSSNKQSTYGNEMDEGCLGGF